MPKNRGKRQNSRKTQRKRRRQLRAQPDGREKEIERDYEMTTKEELYERRTESSDGDLRGQSTCRSRKINCQTNINMTN